MSGARVLVTGGAGFIGSHTAERFARDGSAVRILDNLSSGQRGNCAADWTRLERDVRDAAAVDEAVAGCDTVVHLAAFTSVPESFERHEDCFRTNVLGTIHVLDACVRHGVEKLVFASSSAVYGAEPDAPKREAECPDPISPYGVSKLEGEHLLGAWHETRGLATAALRFFNVYGPRQAADSDYAAAVPIFTERGLRDESLTVYGDGKQTRDIVFVADVAEAIFRAARGDAGGVFNVGTGREISVVELADTIAGLTGGPAEHVFAPTRAGDVRSSTADVSQIEKELGWQPSFTLEQGLSATIDWYREKLGTGVASPAG
jgi:UDP-glucose 4-epimerase